MRTGRLFVAGLWALGILSGVLVAFVPEMLPLPTPHLTVPLLASLAVELLIRPAIRAGQLEPITMNERAAGVIGAAIVSLAVAALVGSPKPSG